VVAGHLFISPFRGFGLFGLSKPVRLKATEKSRERDYTVTRRASQPSRKRLG
jgi:hypothetical protein